jgi:NADPH:quinone reductase-like Zn-dependent oxidoreductase
MKAAILDAFGQGPRYGEFDEPVAGRDETIVEVTAAPIKQFDRALAVGAHFASPKSLPVVCGTDGAGRLGDGTPVYFTVERQPFGAMAERAPAAWTVPLPGGLDDGQAAAIVNPALAAWLPLVWRARLQPGEDVLVLGATGASGRMAVRAAPLLGARRVVVAGRRQDVLNTLGADATIDLRLPTRELEQAFADQGAEGLDVVVDYLWGPPAEALIAGLSRFGPAAGTGSKREMRLISVGAMAGQTINLSAAALRSSPLTILGSGIGNVPPLQQLKEVVADILARAAAGQIAVEIVRRPLAQVGEIWQASAEADARTVLTPAMA